MKTRVSVIACATASMLALSGLAAPAAHAGYLTWDQATAEADVNGSISDPKVGYYGGTIILTPGKDSYKFDAYGTGDDFADLNGPLKEITGYDQILWKWNLVSDSENPGVSGRYSSGTTAFELKPSVNPGTTRTVIASLSYREYVFYYRFDVKTLSAQETMDIMFSGFNANHLGPMHFYGTSFNKKLGVLSDGPYVPLVNSACEFSETPIEKREASAENPDLIGTCTIDENRGLPLEMVLGSTMKELLDGLLPPSDWANATKDIEAWASSVEIVDDPAYPYLKGLKGDQAVIMPSFEAGERNVLIKWTTPAGGVEFKQLRVVTPAKFAATGSWVNTLKNPRAEKPANPKPQPGGNTEDSSSSEVGIAIGATVGVLALIGGLIAILPQLGIKIPGISM